MKFLLATCVTILCVGQVCLAPRKPRLTLAEDDMPMYYVRNINGDPGSYSFGYDFMDPGTGNSQYRNEQRYPNGTVVGGYGYIDAAGKPQRFSYVADAKGYRVFQEVSHLPFVQPEMSAIRVPVPVTEPSITWSRPKKKNKRKPAVEGIEKTENIKTDASPGLNNLLPPSFYAIE